MIKSKTALCAIFILLFLAGCKKEDNPPSAPVISPGTALNKILFEAETNSSPNQYQLFTMNADGTGEVQLTTFTNGSNSVYTGQASWSPDGTKIVFITNKDDNTNGGEIYVMNSNGTGVTRLTDNTRVEQQPTYSPDGTKILFEAETNSSPNQYQLFVMNADGTGETQLTTFTNGSNYVYTGQASWSPDGTKIVFVTNKDDNLNGGEIYTINSNGTGATRITNNSRVEEGPSYSPNGSKILFEAEINSSPNQYQLLTMNADGTGETQLTTFTNGSNSVYTGQARWSPDGTKIVFVTNKDNHLNGGEIYTIHSDGTGATRITNNSRVEEDPQWK